MRIRTPLSLLATVVAVGAFTAPVAQADEVVGDTTIIDVRIADGKPVVIGKSGKVSVNAHFTAMDPAQVEPDSAMMWLYHGAVNHEDEFYIPENTPKCEWFSDGTKLSCWADYDVFVIDNSHAGTWAAGAFAQGVDGDYADRDKVATFKVLRKGTLTANASPEPVKKGRTVTVTGKLSRADWAKNTDAGYKEQSVKLQFRKKGSSTYTTVKTVKSGTNGALKATTTAKSDGYYRFAFAGNGTTASVNATGDLIDVK
jgi:hypothetical protein